MRYLFAETNDLDDVHDGWLSGGINTLSHGILGIWAIAYSSNLRVRVNDHRDEMFHTESS